MKLISFKIDDLFYNYDYNMSFNEKHKISIIHAPNGFGKTTILKLIKDIIGIEIGKIADIPFTNCELKFSNNTILKVEREEKFIENIRNKNIKLKRINIKFSINIDDKAIYNFELTPRNIINMAKSGIEKYMGDMERRRQIMEGTPNSSLLDVILNEYSAFRMKFIETFGEIKVHYITSNRLYSANNLEEYDDINIEEDDNNDKDDDDEVIVIEAKEISEVLKNNRFLYQNISEKKDRNFPNRFAEYALSDSEEVINIDEISKKIDDLEKQRKDLEKLGLVAKGGTTQRPPQNKKLSTEMLKFYKLYIEDNISKLEVFDDISKKLSLLLEIINNKNKFSNKIMEYDSDQGIVFRSISKKNNSMKVIPLEKLSSGEKNEFILYYELIFKSKKNYLVLIDEPEISLHVVWQMKFVEQLNEICEINKLQAVIATHSPDIVNGNDDLLICLGEDTNEN